MHPKGAIKTQGELTDLIVEARTEKKAIRLYAVEQGGHFSEVFLTSKSKCFANETSPDIYQVKLWARSPFGQARFCRSSRCLGDLNIASKTKPARFYNRHMLFSNRKLAEAYSTCLKNDLAYQREIREHHARCARMFRYL